MARCTKSLSVFAIACLALLQFVCAEVTVLKIVQSIYDRSPKLRIRGSGFDADDHDIELELGAQGQTPLRADKDYLITKDVDGDGLILKLLTSRKWVDLDGRTPPVSLVLTKVTFSSNPSQNLLLEPVIIANVYNTPDVEENDDIIYTTASNELRINGTGFQGCKKVDLFFDPPLFKEVGYEIVSPFPLARDQVVLRLRHGYKWREEPGPLSIIGVDTGGGPVKVNGDDGVRVAEVQADLDLHGVTVETTAPDQVIYHDQSSITIAGTGFNPLGNTLRWANGLLGKSVNYTITQTGAESLTLKLSAGSHWRKNVENLPGYLTLLAVNAGEGYVAVGPTNARKGRDVATVFERPTVYSANTKLYRTHSHELHITGEGFTQKISKTQLRFEPPLVQGVDYEIEVIDRTEMEITLLDGHAWREDEGPLLITAINTRDDEAGWVAMPGDGIHVAEVKKDIDTDLTGGVEVYPMGTRVYQSALQEEITLTGNGFKEGMTFSFEPDLKVNVDYDMEIVSKNSITMRLRPGKVWSTNAGFIVAKHVTISGKTYSLAGTEGIRVAVVLANPVVYKGEESFHETQSKVITIYGKGFTNVADSKIIVRPTSPGAYRVLAVMTDMIRLQLKQGYDWLPSYLSLTDSDESKKIPLQVTGLDTGAGEIVYEDPITIGYVVKDREGVVCDDSCEFAFDGVCDDGSESSYYYYYDYGFYGGYYGYYGYFGDDDFGGYYGYGYGDIYGGYGYGYGFGYGFYGYGFFYDDYYMFDDGYTVSACVEGTDCTDCGGVDAIIDYSAIVANPDTNVESCVNTCPYARDGVCDDPRGANYCKLGTDCQDCGPVGADNFTRADDDGWWDDDDDYWTFNDGNFLDQTKGLEANRHRVKVTTQTSGAGAGAMFLVILEGMVYTVGAIFAAIALYLGFRVYNGQPVPFLNMFNPDSAIHQAEMELPVSKRVPITPDVVRT